jgi:hypothetical protein
LRAAAAVLLLTVACKGADRSASKQGSPPDSARVTTSAELPPMPRYPEASRGHMEVRSAGPQGADSIQRDWAAEAGWCDSPPMLLVKSEQPGQGGTLVLLALPADRITTYPVTTVAQGLPTPPAAQIGVQVYRPTGSSAYQASEGNVDLYAFGPTVSGRFAVTLREINRNEKVRFAGAFREIPLSRLDPAFCTPAASGVSPRQQR